jgi:hypothetical protein
MSLLSASEVLAQLTELGDDSNPKKQAYKSTIAGHEVELWDLTLQTDDPDRTEPYYRKVRLRAEGIEGYLAKGAFAIEEPQHVSQVATVLEPPAEPEGDPVLTGRGKKGG